MFICEVVRIDVQDFSASLVCFRRANSMARLSAMLNSYVPFLLSLVAEGASHAFFGSVNALDITS